MFRPALSTFHMAVPESVFPGHQGFKYDVVCISPWYRDEILDGTNSWGEFGIPVRGIAVL